MNHEAPACRCSVANILDCLIQTIPHPGECWCRPPRNSERLEGLSRTHIFTLIREGKLKSTCIRSPGNQKGIRLVWLPSVREWIEKNGVAGGGQ